MGPQNTSGLPHKMANEGFDLLSTVLSDQGHKMQISLQFTANRLLY